MRRVLLLLAPIGVALLATAPLQAGDGSDSWNAPFDRAVSQCDQLVIREVGHPPDVVAEVRGTDSVASILDMIEFDPEASGPACCCPGSLEFVFLRSARRIASLTFHHGRSFRWNDGHWLGDGHLTKESGWALSRWLATNGATLCLHELEVREAGDATRAWIQRRAAELLPPKSVDALARAQCVADKAMEWGDTYDTCVELALRMGTRSEAEFLRRLLALYGCHEGTWSLSFELEEQIAGHLRGIAPATYAALLREVPDDAEVRNGLARILFIRPRKGPASKEAVTTALETLAAVGLTHPRPANRRQTMAGLLYWSRETSAPWLRKVLAGTLPPRPLSPASTELEGAGDGSPWRGEYPRELDAAGDRATAAWFLSQVGDVESIPTIEELAASAEGVDAHVLQAALKHLADR